MEVSFTKEKKNVKCLPASHVQNLPAFWYSGINSPSVFRFFKSESTAHETHCYWKHTKLLYFEVEEYTRLTSVDRFCRNIWKPEEPDLKLLYRNHETVFDMWLWHKAICNWRLPFVTDTTFFISLHFYFLIKRIPIFQIQSLYHYRFLFTSKCLRWHQ